MQNNTPEYHFFQELFTALICQFLIYRIELVSETEVDLTRSRSRRFCRFGRVEIENLLVHLQIFIRGWQFITPEVSTWKGMLQFIFDSLSVRQVSILGFPSQNCQQRGTPKFSAMWSESRSRSISRSSEDRPSFGRSKKCRKSFSNLKI